MDEVCKYQSSESDSESSCGKEKEESCVTWETYKEKLADIFVQYKNKERYGYTLQNLADVVTHMAVHGFRLQSLPIIPFKQKTLNSYKCLKAFHVDIYAYWDPEAIFATPVHLSIPDVFAYFSEAIQSVIYDSRILSSFYKKYCHQFNTDYAYEPSLFYPYAEFVLHDRKCIQLHLQGILQLSKAYKKSDIYEQALQILYFRGIHFEDVSEAITSTLQEICELPLL